MQTLADFLNHGTLPFIGRGPETDRILDFWRGTFEATELRALLLTGEAGIGKSRLLEHIGRRIVDGGECLVHAKIYPESTASFPSLVARALWHRDAGRAILGEEPESTLTSVGTAMQRLARLRPTIFVLEDLHLLGGESLPALNRLLNLLADETISVLALARPVELEARAVLESYLIDEITLHGLDPEECAGIWEKVCGSELLPERAAVLHDATAGNPLALRSALRSMLKSANGGRANLGASADVALTRTLKRSVGLLADGMTSHLSAEELKGAKRLAALGEIFSREAATLVLEDAEPLIDALLFKGIVATAVAPPDPLPGEPGSEPPLGFTHTLLHRHLLAGAPFDADRLVRVVADCPIYSIVPFRLLAERIWSVSSLDPESIARAFDRTIRVQIALGQSALWRSTEQTWRTAVLLLLSRLGSWNAEEWESMLVRLIHHKLNLVRREPEDVRRRWLDYLLAVTEGSTSDEMVKGRFHAFYHRDLLGSAGNPAMTRELWEEAEPLVERGPHLRFSFAYTDYVYAACVGQYVNGDTAMMRRIEGRAAEILASDELPERVRRPFERRIRPPFLKLFENEEELRARLEQVARLERTVEKADLGVWTFCIDLLADVAEVESLGRICDGAFPLMKEQGMYAPLATLVAKQQRVGIGRSDSFPAPVLPFENALAQLPEWRREQIRAELALPLLDAAILRDEHDRGREIIERYGMADEGMGAAQRLALALRESDPRSALLAGRAAGRREEDFTAFIDLAIGGENANLQAAKEMLRAPVLRLTDVLGIIVAADLIDLIEREETAASVPADLLDHVRDAVARALEWLAAPGRELFAYMRPLLVRGEKIFERTADNDVEEKIDELAAVHLGKLREEEGDGRLELTMLGTIVARTSDGAQQRFQGARARMLLAMMVINEMLEEPLTSAEFCRIAAGGDVMELESARDIVKTTVHRIRDVIGRDAVITDGGAPRLNSRLVGVDLLEAKELLKRAGEALRRSSPMQAKGALMAALEITRGEVPFPSLYDDFIEAVREDFENELRTTAIDVAGMLVREGGTEDAADVLRRACEAIPGDEELAELLSETLRQAGRRADAERVKMKVEAEGV